MMTITEIDAAQGRVEFLGCLLPLKSRGAVELDGGGEGQDAHVLHLGSDA